MSQIKAQQNLAEIKKGVAAAMKKKKIRKMIKSVAIFGSFARGTQKKKSDIDFLVELENIPIGLDFFDIQYEFERQFQRKADVCTPNGLSPFIKEDVLKSAVKVFDKKNEKR